ncbi:MAG: CHAT domain-containing protein [Smithellaceae bacterium]
MTSLKVEVKNLWIWGLFILLAVSFTGCVGTPLKIDPAKDTNIKFIKAYQEISAGTWQKTDMMVQKGEAVIIVPLYPRGFIHSVQGRIGETGKPFEGLDVDLGDIYTVQAGGVLHLGMGQKADPVHTGIFVFKTSDFDSIISDLIYLQKNNKDVKMINLSLALLLKKQSDRMLARNKQAEALPVLDQSITYLEQAEEKLYSRTIYQLYREKAVIYKNSQDMAGYNDNITKSYNALIRASEYYSELNQSRFSFMKQLTAEEKFILVTKTGFFEEVKRFDQDLAKYGYRNMRRGWGDQIGLDNLTHAYQQLCRYYMQNGNLSLSLKYGKKAVEQGIEQAKNRGSKDLLGNMYMILGVRYMFFSFNQEAEENFKLALDNYEINSPTSFWTILYLANLDIVQKKYEAAEQLFKLNKINLVNLWRRMMNDLVLARMYKEKQDHDRAIQIGNSYLNYQRDLDSSSQIDVVSGYFLLILDSYAIKGTAEEANKAFNTLRKYLDSRGNPPKLELQYALAFSKFNKRFGKDEIAPLENAIASLEAIRPTAAGGKDYEYWENMLKVYDMTIASQYSQEQYLAALNTVEKARSRRFLDDLGNKKLGAKGMASLMTQRANETLDALAMLETDMVEAAQTAGIKVRSVYDKDSRLGKKIENYKAALKQVSDSDQQFGVVTNIVPVSVENLQKHIPVDTTVIEYYQSEDTLYTWVIDNKKVTAVKQELSKGKLRKLIEQYRKSLYLDTTKRGVNIVEKETADFTALQREAYKLLIAPVEKLIKTKKICIVPYDILNYLPFQSLQDGKQYLIEKYSLSYLPSLSVLEYLRKRQKKDEYKILALGNPDLNDSRMDLPAAEKEVDMIKDIFPNTTVFKRDKATAALVKRISPQYDIVHFAAHGQYNAAEPLSSCLYLAAGEGNNGKLEVREIFDMNINADMIVTSACQTALGKIGRGDEVLGLTRAFMYAGANSVFGSLWSISDEATSVLMKEFYTNIKIMEKTEALRQAQIKMIQSKEYSHPFYWASFNITGVL